MVILKQLATFLALSLAAAGSQTNGTEDALKAVQKADYCWPSEIQFGFGYCTLAVAIPDHGKGAWAIFGDICTMSFAGAHTFDPKHVSTTTGQEGLVISKIDNTTIEFHYNGRNLSSNSRVGEFHFDRRNDKNLTYYNARDHCGKVIGWSP